MGAKARVDLVLDCADPTRLALFWREALAYRDFYADDMICILVLSEGNGSPPILQRVPELKVVKNRMHLDIVVDDIEPEIEGLERHGADRVDERAQSPGDVESVRMCDPEDNEFCVSTGVEW